MCKNIFLFMLLLNSLIGCNEKTCEINVGIAVKQTYGSFDSDPFVIIDNRTKSSKRLLLNIKDSVSFWRLLSYHGVDSLSAVRQYKWESSNTNSRGKNSELVILDSNGHVCRQVKKGNAISEIIDYGFSKDNNYYYTLESLETRTVNNFMSNSLEQAKLYFFNAKDDKLIYESDILFSMPLGVNMNSTSSISADGKFLIFCILTGTRIEYPDKEGNIEESEYKKSEKELENGIYVINTESRKFEYYDLDAYSASFSPTDNNLFLYRNDHEVVVYNFIENKIIYKHTFKRRITISAINWLPNGKQFVVSMWNGDGIMGMETCSNICINPFTNQNEELKNIQFGPSIQYR